MASTFKHFGIQQSGESLNLDLNDLLMTLLRIAQIITSPHYILAMLDRWRLPRPRLSCSQIPARLLSRIVCLVREQQSTGILRSPSNTERARQCRRGPRSDEINGSFYRHGLPIALLLFVYHRSLVLRSFWLIEPGRQLSLRPFYHFDVTRLGVGRR